jgi:DNA methylase
MREMIAWALRQRPESSDRYLADGCGVDHKTVGGVRRRLESTGEIPQFDARRGANGKRYPAAKPTVYSASTVEGRRATSLLNQLGEDAPPGPASLQGLHKRLALKEREALESGPEVRLPARIKIERCDFRDLPVPDGSVDLIFTDPIWGDEGRAMMPEFAAWAARKLKPDGGLLLLYTGHAGLLEVGGEIARKLTYVWTISCVNGPDSGRSTRHDLMIRCCWRPVLVFCRGEYRAPGRVFDDVVISESSEKTHHRFQQPIGEALFYAKSLTGPKAVVCDPFLGSGTTACAVVRLGQSRRFWGSEIDAETCAIARRRVAEELRSPGVATIPAEAVPAR